MSNLHLDSLWYPRIVHPRHTNQSMQKYNLAQTQFQLSLTPTISQHSLSECTAVQVINVILEVSHCRSGCGINVILGVSHDHLLI